MMLARVGSTSNVNITTPPNQPFLRRDSQSFLDILSGNQHVNKGSTSPVRSNQPPSIRNFNNNFPTLLADASSLGVTGELAKPIPRHLSTEQAHEASRQIKALRFYYKNLPNDEFAKIFQTSQSTTPIEKTLIDTSLARLDTQIFIQNMHKAIIVGDPIKGASFLGTLPMQVGGLSANKVYDVKSVFDTVNQVLGFANREKFETVADAYFSAVPRDLDGDQLIPWVRCESPYNDCWVNFNSYFY